MAASLAPRLALLALASRFAGVEAYQPPSSLSPATGAAEEEAADALGLLQQTSAAVRAKGRRGGFNPQACFAQEHPEDLDTPIMQLKKEYPEEDLFCRFSWYVPWFLNYPIMHVYQSYVVTDEQARETQGHFTGFALPDGRGPIVKFHTEATPPEGITTHIDSVDLLDDIRCYTLGFLKNQGLDSSLMHRYEEWKQVADRECEKIGQEYQFTDQELTVRRHKDLNADMTKGAACAAGLGAPGCRPVTTRDIKLHAYQKCLLGDEAPEMSFCYSRGCLLEGHIGHIGHIGHFSECL